MLDTDTKRRIDNARDILVGKVPEVCFNPFFPFDGNGFVRLPE